MSSIVSAIFESGSKVYSSSFSPFEPVSKILFIYLYYNFIQINIYLLLALYPRRTTKENV